MNLFYNLKTFQNVIFCLILLPALAGCDGGSNLAPVTEVHFHALGSRSATHRVVAGETLYAIAFRYDTDFKTLAYLNHLNPPYRLKIGQILRIKGILSQNKANKVYKLEPKPLIKPHLQVQNNQQPTYKMPEFRDSRWYWPVRGRVISTFIPAQGKKGINIASHKGEAVHAASSGVVAYAGSGLAGYGNLIIIKHSNDYLTAYGNNAKILISEGQTVRTGQVIAEAGVLDRKYWGVHFEIRKKGIPVNPLNYLK